MTANAWPAGPVYVAGHQGLVGSAILRLLTRAGCPNLLTRTHAALDLTHQAAVEAFFAAYRPARVYLAAARVGGIGAQALAPAAFIHDNLLIATNVIGAAYRHGVGRLLLLGSASIYPREASVPIAEEALLTGPLEPISAASAVAQVAGLQTCDAFNRQYDTDFRCLLAANVYGPGDNFNLGLGHVIPALIRRFHGARRRREAAVSVWGSGLARREFLHVNDLAAACVHVMDLPAAAWRATTTAPVLSHLNVGSGRECGIAELASLVATVTGYRGRIVFDRSRPDGAPRRLLDSGRLLALGWQARIPLEQGLADTYAWYRAHRSEIRK